ncbi:MAG: tetratricopeptide repeat protein [Polyangiales bacterium]
MLRPVPLVLLLSLTVGCPKQEKPSSEEKPATKSSDDQTPAPAAAPAPKKKKIPAPKPLDSKEKTALADYQNALKKGRKLTLAKDWDGAIASFDDALKAMPDDARALSERGYAKLLAKRWDAARIDLDKAQKRTTDRGLQAQIWYNLGLVEEGKGDAEAAKQAFAKSNELRPTDAAKKKLEGKSVCAAAIATRESAPSKANEYATWKALYDALANSYENDMGQLEAKAKDETEAKQTLCEDNGGCKGDGPFVIWIGVPTASMRWSVVKRTAEGKLLAFESNEAGMGGRCTWRPEVTIASQDGLVHVVQQGEVVIPEFVGTDGGPCKESEGCMSACNASGWERVDSVYDFDKKQRVVRVEQNAAYGKDDKGSALKPPTKVSAKEKIVTLSGGGCDREIK